MCSASESGAADALVISQRALGRCVELERKLIDLEEGLDDLDRRVDALERDLDD